MEESILTVNDGDTIKIEYVGKLDDGTIFDASEQNGEPLTFTVGSGQVIKGFDEGVKGMEIGEERELTIEPENAYGQYNPNLVQTVQKEMFPQDAEIEEGMMFLCGLNDGRQVPARIATIKEKEVTIDFNPPLAGKTLYFSIKLLEIVE